jgi:hypothetical protein
LSDNPDIRGSHDAKVPNIWALGSNIQTVNSKEPYKDSKYGAAMKKIINAMLTSFFK